jgi:phage FluMu gp28-like protein
MKRMLQRADPQGKDWSSNDTDKRLTLSNGAVLWFKSGEKPDNLYGEDVYAAVIDEATRVREESWWAVRSTLTATRGPVRIIGNVKGRKNWAYQMARKAEAGERDHHYAKLTAYDAVAAKVLSQDEVEDAKRTLPEAVFRELYLAEPSDDGGNPFGIAAIRALIIGQLAEGPVLCWGVDLAKSSDWTVAIGLNAQGRVCAFQRWQGDWRNTRSRLRAMLRNVPSLVDSTGVGDPIVEDLQAEAGMQVEGYHFTRSSKQKLMEGLVSAIHNVEIGYPEGPIVNELESFEYEVRVVNGRTTGVTYEAPPGQHDDCVCALALAVEKWRTMPKNAQLVVLGVEDGYDADDDWMDADGDEWSFARS